MPQREFADLLNAKAPELGLKGGYDSSAIARLEKNERRLHLDDITVIAAVDPKQRGREWLGWGTQGEMPNPALDRGLTLEEEERAIEAAAKRNRAKTHRRGGKSA